MWRDLVKNRAQFIAIYLMSLSGLLIFVGIDAESAGAAEISNAYYEQHNLCDIWVQGAGFSDDEVREAMRVTGVKNVEKRLTLTGTTDTLAGTDTFMYINFLTTNDINRLLLYKGDPYSREEEGVWLEEWFARTNRIGLGDTITIEIDSMQIDAVVRGLVDAPDYVYYVSETEVMYPNYQRCGLAFMSSEMFPDPSNIVYNKLIIDVRDDMSDDDSISVIKDKLKNTFDRDDIAITDRHQDLSYATFDAEISQHRSMGFLFAVIFFSIALLGIVTTMARVTANQRTQIGTLKALGLTKNEITLHYVSYGFVISLFGCISGAWIGFLWLPAWLLGMFEGSYLIPGLKGVLTPMSVAFTALSVLAATLVGFFTCRKELKDPPAVTLKPPSPKKVKHSALEKSKLWLKLNFSTQWNIRDVFRNKMRSLMGIMGVTGCAMLLCSGFGTFDSIDALMDKMYGELMTANNKIMLSSEADYTYAYDLNSKLKGQMIQETAIELESGDVKKSGSATILDKGNYMHIQDMNLKPVKLNRKGIAITYKMAGLLDVHEGDFVRWHVVGDDEWQYTRITQIYRDPSVQGLTMTRDVFEGLDYTFRPTAILTNKSVPEDLTDEDEVSTVLNVADMKKSFSEQMEMMNAIVFIMVVAAVFLGVVVLYNLGVLSFVEKTREVATLKVLGFESGKIRRILQKQNIWLTSIGIVTGLSAGWGMLYVICTTVSDTLDMYPALYPLTYVYTVGGTFLVSITVNSMFSGKVRTIDMVDALKGVE